MTPPDNGIPPSQLTPNLGLYKPAPGDRVDIGVFNTNADLIDAAIAAIEEGNDRPRAYRHEQSTPSAEWTVEHDLGYRPAGVLVMDSAGTIVEGAVTLNTEVTTVLSFAAAFSGTADLS